MCAEFQFDHELDLNASTQPSKNIYSHSIFGRQIGRDQCISIDDRFVRPNWNANGATITVCPLFFASSMFLCCFVALSPPSFFFNCEFFHFYEWSFFDSLLFVAELVSRTLTARSRKLCDNWWRWNDWTNHLFYASLDHRWQKGTNTNRSMLFFLLQVNGNPIAKCSHFNDNIYRCFSFNWMLLKWLINDNSQVATVCKSILLLCELWYTINKCENLFFY